MGLRRTTSRLLVVAALLVDLAALAVTVLGAARSPVVIVVALIAWVAASGAVQLFTGERFSRVGCAFSAGVGAGLAAVLGALVTLHAELGVSPRLLLLAGGAIAVLHGAILLRLLVAAGSADDPYED